MLANVILDVEPLLVMVSGANYPLHGYLHTVIAAVGVGLLFGSAMFLLERRAHPLYETLLLETDKTMKMPSYLAAGVLGAAFHVLFDSPLYRDIKPLYPLSMNPLYGLVSSSEIYLTTVWMGILGAAFFLSLLVFKLYGK